MNNYELLDLITILNIIKRNRYFIMTIVAMTILIGLIVSGIRIYQNPSEYKYKAIATLELINGEDMINQPQIVLHLMESRSLLESIKYELRIRNDQYTVRTEKSIKQDQFQVILEGPDKTAVVSVLNELISQNIEMISSSMLMSRNEVVDYAKLYGEPIRISKEINIFLNIIVDFILGFVFGVFIVFFVRYVNDRVNSNEELEKILNSQVLIEIPNYNIYNKYNKYFKVK